MLEQAGLLLGPWTPPADPAGAARHPAPAPTRAILDPDTRHRLGVVRWRRGWPWPRWVGGQTLEVCETEDESLLCTVHAPWLLTWVWEVYDAEERRVAVVRGPEILDGYGRPLAVLQWPTNGQAGRFLTTDGVELAELTRTGEETLLQFSVALANQPFAKMALLGTLLCRA